MKRKRDDIEERRVEQLLARLRRSAPTVPDHELRALARSAAAESRPSDLAYGAPARRRLRLRWAVAAAAVALLVGSGLGFSLGSSVTPSGSARSNFVGLGFLPARGWTVVQTGTFDATGRARAIATNVALDPQDDLRETPLATLESLPERGVLIHVTFATRGDPGVDVMFPTRELPLQATAARSVPAAMPLAKGLAQYRLRAGIGGYNVDARIYFGAGPSPANRLATVQKQLNRLVVASERVTIFARPSIASSKDPVTLFGSVDNRKANEVVEIQAKDCGQTAFHAAIAVRTEEGGRWSTEFPGGISSTVRAVWMGEASPQVTVRVRAWLQLRQLPASRTFAVAVVAARQFWHRRVVVQRFDRRLGTWSRVKTVLLTEQGAFPGSGAIKTSARFTVPVPKGTPVRVVLPLSQARPCFLAGVSNTWRA